MASTFSINQVRHFYVCNDIMKTGVDQVVAPMDFFLKVDATKQNARVVYCNSLGEKVGTDLINPKNIISASASVPKFNKTVYTVTPETPIIGKTYTLRITMFEYGSPSRESQYYKFASATATTANVADLSNALIADLKKSLEVEPVPVLDVALSGNKIVIKEIEQPWVRGRKSCGRMDYVVQLSPIETPTERDHIWGTVAKSFEPILINGKQVADMEYFYLGSRGDIYRNVGFPHVLETTYQVDPNLNYAMIDIAYFYQGDGMNNQNSDKVVTLCIPISDDGTKVDAIIDSINTSLGTTIAKIKAPAAL